MQPPRLSSMDVLSLYSLIFDAWITAVKVLRNYRTPEIRSFLMDLSGVNGNTAASAAEALRDYPDKQVVSTLKHLASSTKLHYTVVEKAQESLAYIERLNAPAATIEFAFTNDRISQYRVSDGLIVTTLWNDASKELTYGYLDASGAIKIPPTLEYTQGFSEGLASVRDGDWGASCKHGYIDTEGKLVIPYTFHEAADFSEGFAFVEMGEKYGYIDRNGTLVVGCQYSHADHFSEGLAAVEKDNLWGYIDTSGEMVIPPNSVRLAPFAAASRSSGTRNSTTRITR